MSLVRAKTPVQAWRMHADSELWQAAPAEEAGAASQAEKSTQTDVSVCLEPRLLDAGSSQTL